MYDLSRYGPSKIKIGTKPPRLASDYLIPGFNAEAYNKLLVTLPPDMLFRILRGREHSQKFMASFIQRELQSRAPSAECANRFDAANPSQVCYESFYFIMLGILRCIGGIAVGRDADPLFTLLQAADMLTRTDFSDGQQQSGLKMCGACKKDFATTVARAREEVWRLLPHWFGLPGDLKAWNTKL